MKRLCLVAAVTLSVLSVDPLAAQRRDAARPDVPRSDVQRGAPDTVAVWLFNAIAAAVPPGSQRGAPDAVAVWRHVQKATHAAEAAEIELVAAMRGGADVAGELAALAGAIAQLRASGARMRLQVMRSSARAAQRPGVADQVVTPRVHDDPGPEPEPRADRQPKPPAAAKARLRAAVERGLKWLVAHQDEGGRWDADGFMKHDTAGQPNDGAGNPVHDVGVTGLALLALLGDGNTMRVGPYQDNVKRAVLWLRTQQGPNGLFGVNASHDFIYDHAIATLAMCEAYGLSDYQVIKSNAQRGLNYLESHRNPYACWRYQPRDNDNDSSVTSWCIAAYRSGKDHGLEVNAQALEIARAYLDELTDPNTGTIGYTKRGELSSRHPGDHATSFPVEKGAALTAAGLASRFRLGQDPQQVPVMQLSASRILQTPPVGDDPGAVDHYFWHYGTRAMWGMGRAQWQAWSSALTPVVLTAQRQDGNFGGSWDPVGVWGEDGGRVYATALMLSSLQVLARE
jgi:hypothetical protein